jgi:two-component system, NtrC family, nitrogen regulation response regulator NtrX
MTKTILVVDDEAGIRSSLQGILEDEGFQVLTAQDGLEAVASVQQEVPDLVLLDIWMPRLDGLDTLQQLKELVPQLLVVMISGHGTIETAVKSTKLGAYDFIEKPLSLEKVVLTVNNALEVRRLQEENALLRDEVVGQCELVGESPLLQKLREQIQLVAPSAAAVLITGENGTGKEVVAHTIHATSPRSEKAFVTVNCAAIPDELIESELFGHERGAGIGSASQRKGKCDLADGGTLFLDEIGALPLATQAKILRIMQEGVFERVGGNRTIEVDLRIVAATNRQLEEEMRQGSFREDLFYQLNVVPFMMPPLRERPEDVPLLAGHFLELFCRREGRTRKALLPDALVHFQNYDWPGNVRELRNIVERLVIMTPGPTIAADQLPDYFHRHDLAQPYPDGHGEGGSASSLREAREEFEKEFIIQKLEENDWNISKTAEAIELERSNLHRKIKSYGIDMKK